MITGWSERIYYTSLVCIVILYPISLKLCNAGILLLAFNWLVWIIIKPQAFSWNRSMMWLLVSFFLLTAISVLYSHNLRVGIFSLDKKISLLIFPLVIGSSPTIRHKQFSQLIALAVAITFMCVCFCLVAATFRSWTGEPGGFFWKDLTMPLNEFHPTYLSLYINFLIGWLIIYLFENWKSTKNGRRLCVLSLIAFFYLSLILLSSKIHIVLGAIIPAICALFFLKKKRLKIALPLLVVLVGVGAFVVKNTKAAERFNHIQTFSYELNAPVKTFNEFTIRLAIAECSWQILRRNLIFGVGVGDVYDELDKVYREVDYKFGYLDQQNPHNEFLSQWLSTGLVGVSLMVLILTLLFLRAFKFSQYDFLILLILFTVTFLVESALERQKGIVLFSLLTNLYVFSQRRNPAE